MCNISWPYEPFTCLWKNRVMTSVMDIRRSFWKLYFVLRNFYSLYSYFLRQVEGKSMLGNIRRWFSLPSLQFQLKIVFLHENIRLVHWKVLHGFNNIINERKYVFFISVKNQSTSIFAFFHSLRTHSNYLRRHRGKFNFISIQEEKKNNKHFPITAIKLANKRYVNSIQIV